MGGSGHRMKFRRFGLNIDVLLWSGQTLKEGLPWAAGLGWTIPRGPLQAPQGKFNVLEQEFSSPGLSLLPRASHEHP